MSGLAARIAAPVLLLGMALLSACGNAPLWEGYDRGTVSVGGNETIFDVSGDYKIGQPYKEFGKWYYPHHDPDYDETGIASWYGPGFHGRSTANGEIYDQNALTAAHPTLPMPVLVRVTNLENGRSQILRVNDRGPFVDGRIIDVSRHAAEILGFRRQGLARVRVQYLAGGPGGNDGTQFVTSAAVPVPEARNPASRTVEATAVAREGEPPVADGQLFVQMESVRDYPAAISLRERLRGFGETRIDEIFADGARRYRLRIGPLQDAGSAYDMLREIIARGYAQARLVAVHERIIGGAELLFSRQ